MTEQEWLESVDAKPMLDFIQAGNRKLRLFACACVDSHPKNYRFTLGDRPYYSSVASRFADGLVTAKELAFALRCATWEEREVLGWGTRALFPESIVLLCAPDGEFVASDVSAAVAHEAGTDGVCSRERIPEEDLTPYYPAAEDMMRASHNQQGESLKGWAVYCAARAKQMAFQAKLLREIVGNPFRPVLIDPAILHWNNAMIPQLAHVIYDERRYEDLPILADALEEAGCTNPEILDHCRGPEPHVRGCWGVDLLLGKRLHRIPTLAQSREMAEIQQIKAALAKHNANRLRTARELGISRMGGGASEPSYKNLCLLMDKFGQPSKVECVKNGGVLVCFPGKTPEQDKYYLATGFSVGYLGSGPCYFARFGNKAGFGEFDDLYMKLSVLPQDFIGVIWERK
jgi:hypothetical protein